MKSLMLGLSLLLVAPAVFAEEVLRELSCYYPLLLVGGISAVVAAAVFRTARRRYEEIELRKITTMDMPSPR